MSDYRPNEPLPPDDPLLGRDARYEQARSYGGTWGWVAGAVVLVILVAIAFGVGREPSRTASNDVAPSPAPTHMTPVKPAIPPAAVPAPATPTTPAPKGTE